MARKQPTDDTMLAEAEAKYAERRAELGDALARAGCDLYECTAAFLFFQLTRGGLSPCEVSYDELTWRPYRLCCSYATARRTVDRLIRLGIVQPRATSTRSGHRGKNRYVYDAEAVRKLRTGGPLPATPGGPLPSGARLLDEQTPALLEQTPAQEKRRQKIEEEEDLFLEPDQENHPPLHSSLDLPAQSANLLVANERIAHASRRAKGYASSSPAHAEASAAVCEAATDASADVAAGQNDLWLQAERALRTAGLRGVEKALAQARERRVPPQAVIELVAFYRAHRGSWDADPAHEVGVLFPAIRAWRPGSAAGDEDESGHWMLWPTAKRRRIVEQAASLRQSRDQSDALHKAERQAEETLLASYEAQYGAQLDALDAEARDALIGKSPIAKHLRKLPPTDPALRRILLKQLAAAHEEGG